MKLSVWLVWCLVILGFARLAYAGDEEYDEKRFNYLSTIPASGNWWYSMTTDAQSIGTSATWVNYRSLTLRAGEWEILGGAIINANGNTITNGGIAVSTDADGPPQEYIPGYNAYRDSPITGYKTMIIPRYRVSVEPFQTKTVYLKGIFVYPAGNQPKIDSCGLAARRW